MENLVIFLNKISNIEKWVKCLKILSLKIPKEKLRIV